MVFFISLFVATENKKCLCVILLTQDTLYSRVFEIVMRKFQVINKKKGSVHQIYIVNRIIIKRD